MDGKWVTIKGNKIFIKDGQTPEEAFNDFLKAADSLNMKVKKLDFNEPKFDSDFYSNSYKDGYKLKGNEAKLGIGRIKYLIDEYGVWNKNLDYSKAYLAFINPKDFINATSTESDTITREELENPEQLDLDRLNNERQTPFLDIDFDNNEIIGHEGRHRMAALAKAGINKIPVVIRDKSNSFNKTKTNVKNINNKIKGQMFDDVKSISDLNINDSIIPINYKNIKLLYDKFGD